MRVHVIVHVQRGRGAEQVKRWERDDAEQVQRRCVVNHRFIRGSEDQRIRVSEDQRVSESEGQRVRGSEDQRVRGSEGQRCRGAEM